MLRLRCRELAILAIAAHGAADHDYELIDNDFD